MTTEIPIKDCSAYGQIDQSGGGEREEPHIYAQPAEEALASLASHTLCRERKGLVTLQLLNCCRGMQLSNIVLDNTSVKHVM